MWIIMKANSPATGVRDATIENRIKNLRMEDIHTEVLLLMNLSGRFVINTSPDC